MELSSLEHSLTLSQYTDAEQVPEVNIHVFRMRTWRFHDYFAVWLTESELVSWF